MEVVMTSDAGQQADLQKRFQNVFRKGAATLTLRCPYCGAGANRPDDSTVVEFWLHIERDHHNLIPRNDGERRSFRSKTMALAKLRHNAQSGPLSESAVASDLTNPLISTQPLPIENFEELNLTHRPGPKSDSMIEHADKKRACGGDKSPTHSVTAASDGGIQSKSPRKFPISSPLPLATSGLLPEKGYTRDPPNPGKRLFDPSDSNTQPQNLRQQRHPRNKKGFGSGRQSAQKRRVSGISTSKKHSYPIPTAGVTLMTRPNDAKPEVKAEVQPGLLPNILLAPQPQGREAFDALLEPKILSQPETKPISQDQLVAEVKGIYAGLVMVEGKCIQVDLKQAQLAQEAKGKPPELNNEQYQALIALHRTLLHEHHDFFLASQHPSATPAVKRLAIKYAMPARLWRHGIHSFLELLRTRLPLSLEYMLAFIYLAYSMMTLLLETVPSFEDTWIECLGDLGRYRMAIEDDHIQDREIWTQVARSWYMKSANRNPATGRLYHHLAILARPNPLPQLFYYGKSLSVPVPFSAARQSIMTLFEPILNQRIPKNGRTAPMIISLVRCHAIIFVRSTPASPDTMDPVKSNFRASTTPENFSEALEEFASNLPLHIAKLGKPFLDQGYYIAISNCMALTSYGSEANPILQQIKAQAAPDDGNNAFSTTIGPDPVFSDAIRLFNVTAQIHFRRLGDLNVLPYVHTTLVFIRYMAAIKSLSFISSSFPWAALSDLLNILMDRQTESSYSVIEGSEIPCPPDNRRKVDGTKLEVPEPPLQTSTILQPSNDEFRPFPEEWAMRGLAWAEGYTPKEWFENPNVEAEKQYMEAESMRAQLRPERVCWLGVQICIFTDLLKYDRESHRFSAEDNGAEASEDAIVAAAKSNLWMLKGRGIGLPEGEEADFLALDTLEVDENEH